MLDCAELSLEQQYRLRVFADQVETLSQEEAQKNLVEMYRQMMIRDNYYRRAIR